MAVAYTDRVVGLPRELEPWRALRGRGNNIWLRLGSANLPGTGRMRGVRYVAAQYRCGIFVVRVVQ